MKSGKLFRGLALLAFAAAITLLVPGTAHAGVVPSLNIEHRLPAETYVLEGVTRHLEYEWHQAFGTFSSADNRVGYGNFVAQDGAMGGKRQVYTIGFEDMSHEQRWAEYTGGTPAEHAITLNGPAGFVGELYTKAGAPTGRAIHGSAITGHHPYNGNYVAHMYKSGGDSAPPVIVKEYSLYFTSSTHDIVGIALIATNSWIAASGDYWGATLRYKQGGLDGTEIDSFANGVFFPDNYTQNNFMGYFNIDGVDTLVIDTSTGNPLHDGANRFDELAIIVQEKGIGDPIPEPGAAGLLLIGLLGAVSRRR